MPLPTVAQTDSGRRAVDVLLADQATMDKAVAAKAKDPATRKNFALNDLVFIVPAGSKKLAKLEDLKALKRIAIGNPDSVPAGRYTKDALTNAKLWEALQSQLIQGNSVRRVWIMWPVAKWTQVLFTVPMPSSLPTRLTWL